MFTSHLPMFSDGQQLTGRRRGGGDSDYNVHNFRHAPCSTESIIVGDGGSEVFYYEFQV